MKLNKIKRQLRHIWHQYGTMNNIVAVVALLIAGSWAWGSLSVMQRNFALQKTADEQQRQLQIVELEVATLKYQQNYFASDEYKELAVRKDLGLASPGEKLLILPPNTTGEGDQSTVVSRTTQPTGLRISNFNQWINFLTGNNAKNHLQ